MDAMRTLEAVNKHLDLATDPPHGTLMRLREDLLNRAKVAGIEKQTRKAMEKNDLIGPKKGIGAFFGLR